MIQRPVRRSTPRRIAGAHRHYWPCESCSAHIRFTLVSRHRHQARGRMRRRAVARNNNAPPRRAPPLLGAGWLPSAAESPSAAIALPWRRRYCALLLPMFFFASLPRKKNTAGAFCYRVPGELEWRSLSPLFLVARLRGPAVVVFRAESVVVARGGCCWPPGRPSEPHRERVAGRPAVGRGRGLNRAGGAAPAGELAAGE